MNKGIIKVRRFVGLDVHADTISAAIAEKETVRSLGTIPNREESVRRLVKKLKEGGEWAACYEAGPTGYTLYWQLTKLGDSVRGDRPRVGANEARRSGEDRQARCRAAGNFLSGGRVDVGVGA